MTFMTLARSQPVYFHGEPGRGVWHAATFNQRTSRDPSQKLHTELNDAFAKYWKERTGTDVSIRQAQQVGKTVDATVDGLDITALGRLMTATPWPKKLALFRLSGNPCRETRLTPHPVMFPPSFFWYAKATQRG